MVDIFSQLLGGAAPAAQSFAAPGVVPPVSPGQFGAEQVSIDPVGGGGFSQLLSDPAIAQALLQAGGNLQQGQSLGQGLAGGMQTYNQLMTAQAQQQLLKDREAREEKRVGFEGERLGIAKQTADTQAEIARQKGLASTTKGLLAKEEADVDKRLKEAQIGKLTAETSKIKATAETTLKGTDSKLWDQALKTMTETAALGDAPSVREVTVLYNQMAPENKKVLIPFTSADLKGALESSEGSQLSREDQVKKIQENFGPAAAKRFSTALAKRDIEKAKAPDPVEKTGLFNSMFGD